MILDRFHIYNYGTSADSVTSKRTVNRRHRDDDCGGEFIIAVGTRRNDPLDLDDNRGRTV